MKHGNIYFFHINIFGIKIVFPVLFSFLTFAFLLTLGKLAKRISGIPQVPEFSILFFSAVPEFLRIKPVKHKYVFN